MGRIIVLLVTFFIFFFLPQICLAEKILVTATVPVSDLWAESIANNTDVVGFRDKNLISYTVAVKGYKNQLLDKNQILAQVFRDGKLISQNKLRSGEFGKFEMAENGEYEIMFKDITWERTVNIKERLSFYRGTIFAQLLHSFNSIF